MGRKSVAVLNIRSLEISVFVGERGVNRTVVFKAYKSEEYDGFYDGEFVNEEGLEAAVFKAITAVEEVCGERIRTLYIGVPGEFLKCIPLERDMGFSKSRKVTPKDVDFLLKGGKDKVRDYRFIRATSMIYVTADNRRVVDPVGLVSTSLTGLLTYYYCKESFAALMEKMFSKMKISLRFLPEPLAMSSYLLSAQTRDEYAIFLDCDLFSSTFLVLMGNGVLAQRNCMYGKGNIAVLLCDAFDLPYKAGLALLSRANLYTKENAGMMEFTYDGAVYEIDTNRFVETVREGLDGLCEQLDGFLEECAGRELDYKPLYISGEGLSDIRGAFEHLSRRLNRVCEPLVPELPYYNKAEMSSRVALLDMAYEDSRKSGALYRFLNSFGG